MNDKMENSMMLQEAFAVNPFGKEIVIDKTPEAISEIEVLVDEAVEKTIDQYKSILNSKRTDDIFSFDPLESEGERKIDSIRYLETEILTPRQIDYFFHKLKTQYEREKIESGITGAFLSRLMQNAYSAGYNDFSLKLFDARVKLLGNRISGRKNNPLNLEIQGNTGEKFGENSQHCQYAIFGDVGQYSGKDAQNCLWIVNGNAKMGFAERSKNCICSINGDAGNKLGSNSINSTYIIKGNAGDDCGANSQNCTFDLMKETGMFTGMWSQNCTYKTHDHNTFLYVTSMVDRPRTVQLLDNKGKTIKESR